MSRWSTTVFTMGCVYTVEILIRYLMYIIRPEVDGSADVTTELVSILINLTWLYHAITQLMVNAPFMLN